jgi:flagellar basal-body rod protein FlgG
MYKGIYIALSGAVLKKRNLDIFAQNIANANTTGFKKERMSFKDHMIPVDNNTGMIPDGRTMADIAKSITDFTGGALIKTGNPLDLAIDGEGFFPLENGMYTRNGSFTISSDGELMTKDGFRVQGEGGPITVENGNIDVSATGEVSIDGIAVGKIQVVDFEDKSVLRKVDGGLFESDDEGTPVTSAVSQGFVEGSNVNIIQEMVQLITAQREFESYQKMIHAFDEASSKTINEMGK